MLVICNLENHIPTIDEWIPIIHGCLHFNLRSFKFEVSISQLELEFMNTSLYMLAQVYGIRHHGSLTTVADVLLTFFFFFSSSLVLTLASSLSIKHMIFALISHPFSQEYRKTLAFSWKIQLETPPPTTPQTPTQLNEAMKQNT